mgnify:CR=1 FL=1
MTVHFIGAGPGAADLITLRGRDLIAACPVCLYAGSLVPEALLSHCPEGAKIVNTARLSLDEIMDEISAAHAAGHDVARIHSGDLSIWSAMGEQLRRLRALGIPYDVTPGVPSFAAAAATLASELTLPGVVQSVVLTRTSGRATAMPEGETLANFATTLRGRSFPSSCTNLPPRAMNSPPCLAIAGPASSAYLPYASASVTVTWAIQSAGIGGHPLSNDLSGRLRCLPERPSVF